MARNAETVRLTPPRGSLLAMGIVLALSAFTVLILFEEVRNAYLANIALNTIILTVLGIGVILAFRQVLRLLPEIRWVNDYRIGDPSTRTSRPPRLLGPTAALLEAHTDRANISQQALRSILDSIGTRLDESREILRYMTGVLVFLGLLGTFWGLQDTVGSVGNIIGSLQGGGDDFGVLFEDLKDNLEAPLTGMGIAFSSSLFGLASSLVLGFLDLLGGQAQTRFYTDVEDWLTSLTASDEPQQTAPSLRVDIGRALIPALQPLQSSIERVATRIGEAPAGSASDKNTVRAIADLAEGVQGLLQHMRIEQQVFKEQVAAQTRGQTETQRLLTELVDEVRGAREPGA